MLIVNKTETLEDGDEIIFKTTLNLNFYKFRVVKIYTNYYLVTDTKDETNLQNY